MILYEAQPLLHDLALLKGGQHLVPPALALLKGQQKDFLLPTNNTGKTVSHHSLNG
jgi:hypothetical protein